MRAARSWPTKDRGKLRRGLSWRTLAAPATRLQTSALALVIAKPDWLSRSVSFIAGLMDAKVAFVAVDLPFATPLVLHVMAAFAEHERTQIAARTKAALCAISLAVCNQDGAAAMTRRGAHKGGYQWGGGGIDIGRRRFDEIMGQLFVGHEDLRKLESRLSEWRCNLDFPAMREALKAVRRIHRGAVSNGHHATKLQLIRAGHLSRRLVGKALRAKTTLQSMLRNAPPPEPVAPKPKLRLGGPSLREQSKRPLPPGSEPRFRRSKPRRKSGSSKS